MTTTTKRIPSINQQRVLDWIVNDTGSCVVISVAGSGKSTLIEMALPVIPAQQHVQCFAFNTTIAKELGDRIARLSAECGDAGRFANVRAGTFHKVGFGAILRKLGLRYNQVTTDSRKCNKMLEGWLTESEISMYGEFICKLVGLAKGEGIGAIVPDVDDRWYSLIQHHDLYLDDEEASEYKAVDLARQLLQRSNEAARRGSLDFNDQLYIPLLWKLRLWQNDWVIVDEAQDTNPVRRAMARLALKPGGRLIAVGDPKQAIYGFCHPAGTPVLTPEGWRPVEHLSQMSAAIVFNTSGDVSGWNRGNPVLDATKHYGWTKVFRVSAGDRHVDLTPHHKLPVKVDRDPCYFTYMMERNGVYRVGHCASHAAAGGGERRFMLSQRCRMERADRAWILSRHDTKAEAETSEAALMTRGVTGTTFHDKTNIEIAGLESDPVAAFAILFDHGRMPEFPLWARGARQHFEANLPFVTEACNIVAGMRVQVLGEWDQSKRGRSRHLGKWVPAIVERGIANPSGVTYGITVRPIAARVGYQNWPLYAAGVGGGIIVHNTGASHDAIDIIKREFRAVELPLTVSYRCAQAVVREAQEIVPYIEAHPGAPEGKVEALHMKDALQVLGAHDAILCRQTSPLIKLVYGLIARGTPAVILGREIGTDLANLVRKMKTNKIDALERKLAIYRDRETSKFIAKGEEQKAEAVSDRVECVLTVLDNLDENSRTVGALITRIESLFSDTNGVLTLCTGHKAKGKEWKRVGILRPDLMPSKWARQQHQLDQEYNLMYVMYTRAMEHLIFIQGEAEPAKPKKRGE